MVPPHSSLSHFPGSTACSSGHSCTKEAVFLLEVPCLHCCPFCRTRSVKRWGSGTESDLLCSHGGVGGWVFFLGEEDTWIRGTPIAGRGWGGLCREEHSLQDVVGAGCAGLLLFGMARGSFRTTVTLSLPRAGKQRDSLGAVGVQTHAS